MQTGEGKTLVAALPVYLNALTGKGVHVVTVNDYLARRDSVEMGKAYHFLGLTVGLVTHDCPNNEMRRAAYAADVTYGTKNEFGFDYLRDNMVTSKVNMVQRSHDSLYRGGTAFYILFDYSIRYYALNTNLCSKQTKHCRKLLLSLIQFSNIEEEVSVSASPDIPAELFRIYIGDLAISNQYKAFNFLRFLDFRAPRHHAPEAAHVIHHS